MAQNAQQDSNREPEHEADDKPQDKEFMATLAKGLALLGAFDKQRPSMTLSEAARVTGFSRATARRILRTLAELGYVVQNGRAFSLSSGILRLGFAYLATQSWIEQATPLMRQLSEELQESCSAVSGTPDHVGHARGRHPAAGFPYLAGARATRPS
jgi:IclR family pca regulon transcriptional regulator